MSPSDAKVDAARRDIEATFGHFFITFRHVPEWALPASWEAHKEVAAVEHGIPMKYKYLMAMAVVGAQRCRYCTYVHREAAKVYGATTEEIEEAAYIAADATQWSVFVNTMMFDYDEYIAEVDKGMNYVRGLVGKAE